MALMKFREPNQVQWRGARPAHNGTQIMKHFNSNVIDDYIVYTVPAGTTLYIVHYWLSLAHNLPNEAHLFIYDNIPIYWGRLFTARARAGFPGPHITQNLWPPLELLTGWSFCVSITVANWVTVGFWGWLE